MFSLVFFEGRVQVVPPPIVDEEAADVRLRLRADHLGDHLEVPAECPDS